MRWLAYRCLRLIGWRFLGEFPPLPKLVVVGAPHTSNWDFVVFMAALWHFRLKARFLAKRGLFRWPFGRLFAALGAIPVGGPEDSGVVPSAVAEFARNEEMILVIAPEGTRFRAPHWKMGFAAIAAQAEVPLVLAGLDFPDKSVTVGPTIHYDGDLEGLMETARRFY
ncbi:MAG: 1-acyl-sn-glycerol-3-phosphate acyltransferase, partial [Actinobacteria bacterium]|nr:1-acyl-sn-glycerol-3-phosphate acyltransferase [Actinomycetota bacterium]